jgi:hypothetical protein
MHVLNTVSERDPQTGICLPSSLLDTLQVIHSSIHPNDSPAYFADRLFQIAWLCEKPFKHIFSNPRAKIIRRHEMLPFHSLRELDGASINWISRLPGRNFREKLTGRTRALGVVRRFSIETLENQCAVELARRMRHLLSSRLQNGNDETGLSKSSQERKDLIGRCHDFISKELRFSDIAECQKLTNFIPNNVLISDRDYSCVWRAWQWLNNYENDMVRAGERAAEQLTTALFWILVAKLFGDGAIIADCPSLLSDGYMRNFYALQTLSADKEQWLRDGPLDVIQLPAATEGRLLGIVTWQDKPKNSGIVIADGEQYPVSFSNFLHPVNVGSALSFCPQKSGGRLLAKDIETCPSGFRWRLHREETSLIAEVTEFSPGVYCRDEHKYKLKYNISILDDKDPNGRKRFKIIATPNQDENVVTEQFGDLRGLYAASEEIIPSDVLGTYKAARQTKRGNHEYSDDQGTMAPRMLGIDLANMRPQMNFDGDQHASTEIMMTYRHILPETHSEFWLMGKAHYLTPVGFKTKRITIHDLFKSDSDLDQGTRTQAGIKIAENLAREANAGSETVVAYTVPDALDTFSQQSVLTAFNQSFQKALPIPRSVAAALAWQTQEDAIRIGDIVWFLDLTGEAASVTKLIACHDKKLKISFPETEGIFWERHPSEIIEIDSLALSSFRERYVNEFCKKYHLEQVTEADLHSMEIAAELVGIGTDSEPKDKLINLLLESGALVLFFADSTIIENVLHNFGETLIEGIKAWSCTKNEFDNLKKENRKHWLLCPDIADSSLIDQIPNTYTTVRLADSCASEGTIQFLEREQAGVRSWQEHLPVLQMEVIRDGRFDMLTVVDGKPIEPKWHGEETTEVKDTFHLPAGQREIRFPLISGEQGVRLLRWTARLRSRHFPLDYPMHVKMQITYRYGADEPYELLLTPDDPEEQRFEALKVEWCSTAIHEPMGINDLSAPEYPRIKSWEEYRYYILPRSGDSKELINWLCTSVSILNKKCGRIFYPELSSISGQTAEEFESLKKWFSSGFEIPLRVLWGQGRRIKDQDIPPEINYIANQDGILLSWLMNLAGLRFDRISMDVHKNAPLMQDIRQTALLLLCRMGDDVEDFVVDTVRQLLDRHIQTSNFPDRWLISDCVPYALGSGKKGSQQKLFESFLELTRQACKPGIFDPPKSYKILKALSIAAWRNPSFVYSLNSKWLINTVLKQSIAHLNRALQDYQKISKEGKLHYLTSSCRISIELILALLRLRKSENEEFKQILSSRSYEIQRLAQLTRAVDTLFGKNRIELPSRMRLDLENEKPEALSNMMDLTYAANSYLTGDKEAAGIQVAELRDEEDCR